MRLRVRVVLAHLVDERARRRREPADVGAQRLDLGRLALGLLSLLRGEVQPDVEQLVHGLAPLLGDVGDGVVGARRVVRHVALAALAIAIPHQSSRLARIGGSVVHSRSRREVDELVALGDDLAQLPLAPLLVEALAVGGRLWVLRGVADGGVRVQLIEVPCRCRRLPSFAARLERLLVLGMLPLRRLVRDRGDGECARLELARLRVAAREELRIDLLLHRVGAVGDVAVALVDPLQQPAAHLDIV